MGPVTGEVSRVAIVQSGISQDPAQSPSSTIDRVPEEVLLEVFDFYRLHFKHMPSYSNPHQQECMLVPIYERGWNHISGWFTLAHVCQKWRRVVLASTSRLDLSLVITAKNLGRMKTILTPRLPPLPIRIDYEYGALTYNDLGRMDAALKPGDRVRGIVFKGADEHLENLFKAMKFPFPALDRLEIYHSCGDLKLPPTFLRGSAPRLRRLILSPVLLASISQLLSSATALVELSLNIDTIFGPSPAESLVAYLQAMPCLRWLALTLRKGYSPANIQAHPMKGETVISLPKLTFLHFCGHQAFHH